MKSKQPPPWRHEEASALPVWKAFVVQFTDETGAQTETFSGRVEHLSSGRRGRFGSKDELLETLRHMIAELGEKGR